MLLYALLHLTGYDSAPRRPARVPAVGQQDARPPRVRPHARRRDHHRSAGPGLRQRRRHGHRRALPGRHLQRRRPRCRRPLHLRARRRRRPDGGDQRRGRLAGRPSAARQADRPLRRQPHHDRRLHRPGLHRGRRRPLRGLRLARAAGRRRQRPRGDRRGRSRRPRRRPGGPRSIVVRTHIGYGSPNKQDRPRPTARRSAPRRSSSPRRPALAARAGVLRARRRQGVLRGGRARGARPRMRRGASATPPGARPTRPARPPGTTPGRAGCPPAGTPTCRSSRPTSAVATRAASGKVINAVAPHVPTLLGGSADLAPSNNTLIKDVADQQAATPAGRNFHFGVREHAMAAIGNGMAAARRRLGRTWPPSSCSSTTCGRRCGWRP